jgi:predicted ATP-grasp superfamily ATP-dependent carboligase
LDTIADFHAFKEYHERGELGFKDWFKSLRRARVFALFAWDDPLPFLVARKFGLSYARILQYAIGDFLHRKFPSVAVSVPPVLPQPGKKPAATMGHTGTPKDAP